MNENLIAIEHIGTIYNNATEVNEEIYTEDFKTFYDGDDIIKLEISYKLMKKFINTISKNKDVEYTIHCAGNESCYCTKHADSGIYKCRFYARAETAKRALRVCVKNIKRLERLLEEEIKDEC